MKIFVRAYCHNPSNGWYWDIPTYSFLL